MPIVYAADGRMFAIYEQDSGVNYFTLLINSIQIVIKIILYVI